VLEKVRKAGLEGERVKGLDDLLGFGLNIWVFLMILCGIGMLD